MSMLSNMEINVRFLLPREAFNKGMYLGLPGLFSETAWCANQTHEQGFMSTASKIDVRCLCRMLLWCRGQAVSEVATVVGNGADPPIICGLARALTKDIDVSISRAGVLAC